MSKIGIHAIDLSGLQMYGFEMTTKIHIRTLYLFIITCLLFLDPNSYTEGSETLTFRAFNDDQENLIIKETWLCPDDQPTGCIEVPCYGDELGHCREMTIPKTARPFLSHNPEVIWVLVVMEINTPRAVVRNYGPIRYTHAGVSAHGIQTTVRSGSTPSSKCSFDWIKIHENLMP